MPSTLEDLQKIAVVAQPAPGQGLALDPVGRVPLLQRGVIIGDRPPDNPAASDIWEVASGNSGERWAFRYNATSTSAYKWEYIGGSEVALTNLSGTSTSTTGTAVSGSTLIAVRGGDYIFEWGGKLDDGNNWQNVTLILYDVTGSANAASVAMGEYAVGNSGIISCASKIRLNAVAAGRQYQLRLTDSNAVTTVFVTGAFISIKPVRVS